MPNASLAKTFFPGSRKELLVELVSLHKGPTGARWIKLRLAMPLDDGKLVGMPEWVGTAFDHIGKAGTLESSTKFTHALEEMTLYVHHLEESKKPQLTIHSVLLKDFCLRRAEGGEDDEDEALAGVSLSFVAHLPDNRGAWEWLYDYIRGSIFVRFDNTQPDLEAESTPKQLKLGQKAAVTANA